MQAVLGGVFFPFPISSRKHIDKKTEERAQCKIDNLHIKQKP